MVRLAAVFVCAAWSLWASPVCLPGSLSSYLALGSDGCQFQSNSVVTLTTSIAFSSFTYSGDPAGIRISPDYTLWAPGLQLGGFQAAPGSSLNATLTFEVDAPAQEADLIMQGWNGSMTAIESICVGSAFASDGSCPTGVEYATPVNGAGTIFPAASILGVSDRFVLSGGASVAYFENQISQPDPYGYCECGFLGGGAGGDPDPAPEPNSRWLLGGGLGLLGLMFWRK